MLTHRFRPDATLPPQHIEAAEGHAIAHHMGFKDKKDAFWQEMLEKMDTDKDGKISLDEYVAYQSETMSIEAAARLKNELLDKGYGNTLAYKRPIPRRAPDRDIQPVGH